MTVYRKAVYQVVKGEMVEKTTESFEEFCACCKDGWHDHPETARSAVVVEEGEEAAPVKKPLSQMNKTELKAHALAVHGVELDDTKTKKIMLAELKQSIG